MKTPSVPQHYKKDKFIDPKVNSHRNKTHLDGTDVLLNGTAHSGLGHGTSSEDLRNVVGHDKRVTRALELEKRHRTGELLHLVLVGELVHGVGDLLEPGPHALGHREDSCELLADNGLLDERLAEGLTLDGPLERLALHGTHRPDDLGTDHPPLVVEVVHDAPEALVDTAKHVLHRHLHVAELNKGDSRGATVRGVDVLGDDTLRALDDHHGDAEHALSSGAHGSHEVVGEVSVGDPLLGSVHNEVLLVSGVLGRGHEARNVGSGLGLGDGKTETLLSLDAGVRNVLTERRLREGEHRRQTNDVPVSETRRVRGGRDAHHLLVAEHLVEVVVLLRLHTTGQGDAELLLRLLHVGTRPKTCEEDTRLPHLPVHFDGGVFAGLVGNLADRHDLVLTELGNSVAELEVRRVVVGGGDALDEGRVCVRHTSGRHGVVHVEARLLVFLAGQLSDQEALVLREDLDLVKAEERLSCLLSCERHQRRHTTRVELDELADIPDIAVNEHPHVGLGVVAGDLLHSERLDGHCKCWGSVLRYLYTKVMFFYSKHAVFDKMLETLVKRETLVW